jgi:hypothetical protein
MLAVAHKLAFDPLSFQLYHSAITLYHTGERPKPSGRLSGFVVRKTRKIITWQF